MGFYAHQGTADKCRLSWMTTLAACSPSTAKSSNLGKWWQMSILYICCPKFRTEPIVWIILAWMFPVNPHFFSAWSGLVISSHDFAHKSHSSRLTFSFPGMDFWRDSSVQDLTWQPARWKPRETEGNRWKLGRIKTTHNSGPSWTFWGRRFFPRFSQQNFPDFFLSPWHCAFPEVGGEGAQIRDQTAAHDDVACVTTVVLMGWVCATASEKKSSLSWTHHGGGPCEMSGSIPHRIHVWDIC